MPRGRPRKIREPVVYEEFVKKELLYQCNNEACRAFNYFHLPDPNAIVTIPPVCFECGGGSFTGIYTGELPEEKDDEDE